MNERVQETGKRRAESGLAWGTLAALAIYAPVETIYSWPNLGDPFYIIDVIAMALMGVGMVLSLRSRPHAAPGLLTAGWAWAAANFWRAYFDRVRAMRGGTHVGVLELRFVLGELVVSLVATTVGVWLCYAAAQEPNTAETDVAE